MHVRKASRVVNVILITRVETEIWLKTSFNMSKQRGSFLINTLLTALEAAIDGTHILVCACVYGAYHS